MKKQLFILLLLVSGNVLAQRAAVKTNLLHDAATAPSLAAEWAFASRWTLDVAGSACPWNFADNRKWKFWMTQGEARYWLCQSFYGHFLGVHAGGGEYNLSRVQCHGQLRHWQYMPLHEIFRSRHHPTAANRYCCHAFVSND